MLSRSEEELDIKFKKFSSDDNYSSTVNTKDQMGIRENLLADWFQIETGLRITGKTQPGEDDNGFGSSERTELKREAVPADWNLLEASLEGEEQLGDIASQHFGIGAAMMIKFDHIYHDLNVINQFLICSALFVRPRQCIRHMHCVPWTPGPFQLITLQTRHHALDTCRRTR